MKCGLAWRKNKNEGEKEARTGCQAGAPTGTSNKWKVELHLQSTRRMLPSPQPSSTAERTLSFLRQSSTKAGHKSHKGGPSVAGWSLAFPRAHAPLVSLGTDLVVASTVEGRTWASLAVVGPIRFEAGCLPPWSRTANRIELGAGTGFQGTAPLPAGPQMA